MSQTERQQDQEKGIKTFSLEIPEPINTKKESQEFFEKTSLYVPSKVLFDGRVDFRPSSFSDEVLVTRDVAGLLKTVFKYGDVAERYGENGLEYDPSRQQIAIYTLVVCQEHLLWYQRAIKGGEVKVEGDPRLQGKFSVGLGGHKTREDIYFSREDLFFLTDLLPAIQDEVGTMLGLNRGFFAEVQEEIGLSRDQTKNLRLLGGLHDNRIEEPDLKVQVGEVHTGIVAALEVEPYAASALNFRLTEIAKAWWVPFSKAPEEFLKLNSRWEKGEGPRIESWTEVALREFWEDLKNK